MQEEIPNEWFCPISHQLMVDPVIAADGFTYERKQIQNWLKRSSSSPITGMRLPSTNVIPNHALRHTIEQYNQKHQEVKKEEPLPVSSCLQPSLPPITCEFDSIHEDDHYYINCKLIAPKQPEYKKPSRILCVLDISESMDQDAVLGGKAVESHGFSRLDLVKHSINTMIQFMHDTDEMCIIVFNNSAQLLIPFTRTNKAGKTMLRGKVKQMQAGGATNIWDGIKVALDHLGKVGGNYNTFMVLLTDGEPNINPPRGIVPTMEKYLKIENMEVPNIHVFGYGYELDTQLLMEIANVGNGTYTYIPDCSMVGTAFINFMANCLSCYTNRIQLTLQPPPGLKLRILGCNSLVYNPGILLYGRPRNIIIRCQPQAHQSMGSIQIKWQGKTINKTIPIKQQVKPSESMITAMLRVRYVDLLGYLVNQGKPNIKECWERIEEFYQVVRKHIVSEDSLQALAMLKQLKNEKSENEGQVSKAYEKEEWYYKWGQHYVPSLYLAHLRETCTNFKDPALQLYTSDHFEHHRNQMENVFIKMPPPQPTAKKVQHIVYKPAPVSMEDYYDEYGGCIGSACRVMLADGTYADIGSVRKGQKVKSGDGEAVVMCVVRSSVFERVKMVRMGKLQITGYHPVKIKGKWVFPCELSASEEVFVEEFYNLVLENGSSFICEGIQCISLAHNLTDPVAFHPYLGSLVLHDLQTSASYPTGLVSVRGYKRHPGTHQIIKMMVE